MYSENDFRKDFPANKMLNKVNNKANFLDCLTNAVILTSHIAFFSILSLSGKIAPNDLLELNSKLQEIDKIETENYNMHQKYDVTHEDIYNFDF